MTRRTVFTALVLALCAGLFAAPASAQQSLNFQVGSFAPLSESTRANDVLIANREYLSFDVRDLRGATVSADWSFLLGEHIELGIGAGYYQRRMPSVWTELVYDDGSDIEQEITLRIVPVTAMVKFLPLGGSRSVQPYIGVGGSVYFWHYSEIGDFVDLTDDSIYSEQYVGNGTSFGPVGMAGVRFRVSQNATFGAEGRYQWGKGTLSTDSFLSDRIDLGGYSALVTFGYRF
jgi:opacity protein-like surface antigen